MASQFFKCPGCGAPNGNGSRFCSHCGSSFAQRPFAINQPIPKKNSKMGLWIVLGILGLCGFCGLIGAIGDKTKKDIVSQSVNTNSVSNVSSPAATPTPPPTFAQLKEKAQPLLKMPERTEYTTDELKPFDEVMKPLREIPKDAKEYKEAQIIFNQLNKKLSVFLAEIVVLGKKPENSAYDGNVAPAQNYLKTALNDYSSSEYLGWTQVSKTYVGSEPYWTTTVRLRAKNAFGAFVVNEYTFLIRNNQIVKVEK